jgi:hypothetical protein
MNNVVLKDYKSNPKSLFIEWNQINKLSLALFLFVLLVHTFTDVWNKNDNLRKWIFKRVRNAMGDSYYYIIKKRFKFPSMSEYFLRFHHFRIKNRVARSQNYSSIIMVRNEILKWNAWNCYRNILMFCGFEKNKLRKLVGNPIERWNFLKSEVSIFPW